MPVIAINPTTGELESDPEIVTRGFIDEAEQSDFLSEMKQVVEQIVNEASHEERIDHSVIKEKTRLALKRLIQKKTGRRPMILPVVVEV